MQRLALAIEEVEIARFEFYELGGDSFKMAFKGRLSLLRGLVGHERFGSCEIMRTKILMVRTAAAMRSAPTQASLCQSS